MKQGLKEQRKEASSSFLRQGPLEDLAELLSALAAVSENLITYGLNVHNHDIMLLSEALGFYEQVRTETT